MSGHVRPRPLLAERRAAAGVSEVGTSAESFGPQSVELQRHVRTWLQLAVRVCVCVFWFSMLPPGV